jgi:hypothetical protein
VPVLCAVLVVLSMIAGLLAGTMAFFALGGVLGILVVVVEQWIRSGSR